MEEELDVLAQSTAGDTDPSRPRSKLRSHLRVAVGVSLLFLGLILAIPGVPGPGVATIILALVILRDHFTWAKRALEWFHRKAHDMGWPPRHSAKQSEPPGEGPRPRSGDERALHPKREGA
jgi:hypothetical protein